MNYFNFVESPLGELLLVSDGDFLNGLYFHDHKNMELDLSSKQKDPALRLFRETEKQLAVYFAGQLKQFSLPLRSTGTEFQKSVWQRLQEIPYGCSLSYAALADKLGKPGAARAVGRANGLNPLSIIIPCHRVLAASGSLAGYAGGLARKRYLLHLETGQLKKGSPPKIAALYSHETTGGI